MKKRIVQKSVFPVIGQKEQCVSWTERDYENTASKNTKKTGRNCKNCELQKMKDLGET